MGLIIMVKKMQYHESSLQQQLVAALRLRFKSQLGEHSDYVIFAIPNARMFSTPQQASRFSREGLLAGVADLLVMLPFDGLHGLFVEMKKPKTANSRAGVQSPAQRKFEAWCQRCNYAYRVYSDFDHAYGDISSWVKLALEDLESD